MVTTRKRQQLIARLIGAARGQHPSVTVGAGTSSSTTLPPNNKLPCFPLKHHHFGQLAGADARISDSINVTTGSSQHDVPAVATPSDFHSYLCNKINCAQERVVLASLYIGVGSKTIQTSSTPINGTTDDDGICKEDELLQALHNAASNEKVKKVQVLLDSNRALRKVSVTKKNMQSHGSSSSSDSKTAIRTNSAEAVFSRLNPPLKRSPNKHQSNTGLFLFPVNDKRLCTILPSPLDEVAGVFHIKAYIVDDELILSGANLSEEYFSKRLDRYMLFTNGGGGLVDFYANLVDILCDYAISYDGPSNHGTNKLSSLFSLQDEKDRKQKLELSLMHLFDGNNQVTKLEDCDEANATAPVVAYAIPTFQMPTSFLKRSFQVQSDTDVTRNLLSSAINSGQSASVRLSSAYLNLTPKLMSVLTMYRNKNKNVGAPYILTAGAISHGFAPKAGTTKRRKIGIADKIKAAIPEAFLTLVKETARSIMTCGGKILLYERQGWTFHAKGIWITANDGEDDIIEQGSYDCQRRPEMISSPSSLIATIIGSGNYGVRSEDLDVESNCILVFNDSNDDHKKASEENPCEVKESVTFEWNNMCESSNELRDVSTYDDTNKVMRVVLEFMKRYL